MIFFSPYALWFYILCWLVKGKPPTFHLLFKLIAYLFVFLNCPLQVLCFGLPDTCPVWCSCHLCICSKYLCRLKVQVVCISHKGSPLSNKPPLWHSSCETFWSLAINFTSSELNYTISDAFILHIQDWGLLAYIYLCIAYNIKSKTRANALIMLCSGKLLWASVPINLSHSCRWMFSFLFSMPSLCFQHNVIIHVSTVLSWVYLFISLSSSHFNVIQVVGLVMLL